MQGEERMPARIELNRRHVLGAGTAMLAAASTSITQAASENPAETSALIAAGSSPLFPVTETTHGKVRGLDVGTAFQSTRGAMYGERPDAQKMADRHAAAWVAFARTGNPNATGNPQWDPYSPQTLATMVFADDTRVENDHRGDFRKLWDDINPPPGPRG
jgi:para-nitrobenzyl esterase